MKRLILMRHAKSDWSAGRDDHARPLGQRGRLAAPLMAAWLVEKGYRPDAALISDSARTVETFARMEPLLAVSTVRRDAALYLTSEAQMLQTIRTHGSGDTLLVIAHQPGTGALAHALDPAAPRNIPTAAALVFAHDRPWSDLETAQLVDSAVPKELV